MIKTRLAKLSEKLRGKEFDIGFPEPKLSPEPSPTGSPRGDLETIIALPLPQYCEDASQIYNLWGEVWEEVEPPPNQGTERSFIVRGFRPGSLAEINSEGNYRYGWGIDGITIGSRARESKFVEFAGIIWANLRRRYDRIRSKLEELGR